GVVGSGGDNGDDRRDHDDGGDPKGDQRAAPGPLGSGRRRAGRGLLRRAGLRFGGGLGLRGHTSSWGSVTSVRVNAQPLSAITGRLMNPNSRNQTNVQGIVDLHTPESASGNHSTT